MSVDKGIIRAFMSEGGVSRGDGRQKRGNRRCEHALHDAEFLAIESLEADGKDADVDAINESVELADEIYNGVFRKVCRHVDSCDDCNEV